MTADNVMRHFIIPTLVAAGTVVGIVWTFLACFEPSKSNLVWTLVFLVVWLSFIFTLMSACLH